jgi:hypothetical protein
MMANILAECPAGRVNFCIEQGATFLKTLSWYDKSTGVPIDVSTATLRMQIRDTVASTTVIIELSTANGRIVLLPTVVAATPIASFDDVDIVSVTGATFVSDGVRKGQSAVIAGSTSNDGTYTILSVLSETQLVVDATLTVEPAAGTLEVTDLGRFSLNIAAADSATLDFGSDNRAVYDLECEFGTGEVRRIIQGYTFLNLEVTR